MSKLHLAALSALGAALLPLASAHAQQTPQSAVTLSGGLIENAGENFNAITGAPGTSFVLGYTFTVTGPVAVTALGFYDDNNTARDINGNPTPGTAMSQSHQVGIFSDATGTLLVQATVAPGDTPYAAFTGRPANADQTATNGTGAQLFRYDSALKDGATGLVSLPPFVLLPGLTYDIAAVTGLDNYEYLPDTFGTDASVAYGQDRYVSGNATALQAPTQTYGDNYGGFVGQGFFGPNFLFTPVVAPEPSQTAALTLGALGLIGLGLRARRRHAG